MNKKLLNELLSKTNIVGVIASEQDMKVAFKNMNIADIFEWRVDCSPSEYTEDGIKEMHMLKQPIIVTVRDASEGGKQPSWKTDNRKGIYRRHMHLATFIDIEASTASDLKDVIDEAKEAGVGVIISQHFFQGPWSPRLVNNGVSAYLKFGGDVFKTALVPDSFEEVSKFFDCVARFRRVYENNRIAPMLMGTKYGKVSRLLFSRAGVPFVYGHLGAAQVEGQWHVSELREMLARLD
jgi:3-dehydroquinate dehydratase-1